MGTRGAAGVRLADADRAGLRGLLRSGVSRARVQTRARVLLLAAAERGAGARGGGRRRAGGDAAIAEALGISPRTVARIRARFREGGLDAALYDRPRSGRPVEIDGDVEAKLVALACSAPPDGRARWTLQLLADRVVELGYAERISDVTVMDRLKKTSCGPGRSRAGASPR